MGAKSHHPSCDLTPPLKRPLLSYIPAPAVTSWFKGPGNGRPPGAKSNILTTSGLRWQKAAVFITRGRGSHHGDAPRARRANIPQQTIKKVCSQSSFT